MATNDKGLTPMMRQFFSMKEKHPEALLLFRCGDFYETYCDDAVEAARILGITLTRRNNGAASGAEMAGFPHHALDTYLPKLIRAGKRVAICDQLEDPKKKRAAIKGKKGLSEMDKMVKRGITELVTPGVAMGDNVLNYKENNFLAAIHFGKGACGVSLLDISTGEFLTGEGNYDYVEKLLGNFQPKEVLYDRTRKQDFEQQFGTKFVATEAPQAFQNQEPQGFWRGPPAQRHRCRRGHHAVFGTDPAHTYLSYHLAAPHRGGPLRTSRPLHHPVPGTPPADAGGGHESA